MSADPSRARSAAGGALLGKIVGGDTKDAVLRAVLGGWIRTGIAAGTKGKELEIPAGTELLLTLDESLSISAGSLERRTPQAALVQVSRFSRPIL